MDAVLRDLGALLIRALPTFILLFILHFYMKWAFYKPLDQLLKRRWEATEGARKASAEALALAERRAGEYQEAVRQARGEIFAEHEEVRRGWRKRQSSALEETRRKTEALVRQAREGLASETEAAKQTLESESDALAEEIASALLRRKAS
jgi:F-type H+-transporting ATPase subunit b